MELPEILKWDLFLHCSNGAGWVTTDSTGTRGGAVFLEREVDVRSARATFPPWRITASDVKMRVQMSQKSPLIPATSYQLVVGDIVQQISDVTATFCSM